MNAMSDVTAAAVEARGLVKRYGRVRALDGVDLEIGAGRYFALLGPSGGGKTTLLRALGGFVKPDAGEIFLEGRAVEHLGPEKRPTGMVFQSYALFPHMTVAQNVGYGLKLRKLPREEVARQAEAALAQVSLAGYGERRIWELSGGQQQRVQLARALALKPRILLLDEPLAALDAKLRKEMCYELKHLQEEVGITFIHVTHNQEEAMTVADRMALISDGKLVEAGAPSDLYERPETRFAAEFVGERVIFDGVLRVEGGLARMDVPGGVAVAAAGGFASGAGSLSVRSESLALARDGDGLSGVYRERVYLGLVESHGVELPDGREIPVRCAPGAFGAFERGEAVRVSWSPEAARVHAR
ncbi:MAG: ABC transporter ATP-binding protein [Pseudomonadota bacterium]